jgi:hypothetical protein
MNQFLKPGALMVLGISLIIGAVSCARESPKWFLPFSFMAIFSLGSAWMLLKGNGYGGGGDEVVTAPRDCSGSVCWGCCAEYSAH